MAAADSSMPFSPCDSAAGACTDVSVGILEWIFGPVIEKLTTGADPDTVDASVSVLASIFSVFNSGLLVVASLIVSYVAIMGVTNTANEGEARRWDGTGLHSGRLCGSCQAEACCCQPQAATASFSSS